MSKTRRVLLILLALALLTRPVDILLAAMLPDASVNPVPQCIGGMLVTLLLLGLPAWLLRPWTSVRLRQGKSLWPGMALAVCTALLIRAAMTPVDAAWQSWLGLVPEVLPAPDGLPGALLYLAALVIIPAAAEEAFFRGAVLTGLLDGSRRATAALLTTTFFALMHGSVANLPSLLVISLMLTLLMLHTGRLAVPMTAHLVYNLTALNWIEVPGWGSILCGVLLAGLLLLLCIRHPRIAHPPMKRLDGFVAVATIAVLLITNLF